MTQELDKMFQGFRKDAESLNALFEKSGIIQAADNKDSNVIVLSGIDWKNMQATIPKNPRDIEGFEPTSIVLVRWPGKHTSHMFVFQVQDWLEWKNAQNA